MGNYKKENKDLMKCLLKYDMPSRMMIIDWIIRFIKAAVGIGLPKRIARTLVIYTTIGALALLNEDIILA